MTRVLFEAFDTHYISASHLRRSTMTASIDDVVEEEEYSWTFITALFFTATLLTTIGKVSVLQTRFITFFLGSLNIAFTSGYGNLVPVTFQGRMFCIVYALFGVPLILITVADIGKFLSENIIWLYAKYVDTLKRPKRRVDLFNFEGMGKKR